MEELVRRLAPDPHGRARSESSRLAMA
jgi:hypothetical protein